MVKDILTAASVPHRRSRYPKAPEGTYAVYFDNVEREGADRVACYSPAGLPGIYHHDVSIDLYESVPDDKTEAAIEAELNARGLPWTKQERYWLQDVQRYQVIYEFSYTAKV